MDTDKLKEQLSQLNDLIKGLGKLPNIAPSIRPPSIAQPQKPKMVSAAPTTKKDPFAQAKQVADPNLKAAALANAKMQNQANTNTMAYKSESDSKLFYPFRGDDRLASDPMTSSEIYEKYGDNVRLVPVINEKLEMSSGGQWILKQV
jgi:hypothetical protein